MHENSDDTTQARGRNDQTLTAYHEAGHAVMALALGRTIHKVTIVPGKTHTGLESLGQCHVTKGRFKPSRDWLEDEMLIFLAGMVAESQLTGHYAADSAAQDLRALRRLAQSRAGSDRQVERVERRALDKAEYLLADPANWSAVVAIAELLLTQQTISGRAARHLFDQAMKQSS